MARTQFRAQKAADGRYVLEVAGPAGFILDDACRTLAVVYAKQPLRGGIEKLLDGLRAGEENGTAEVVRTLRRAERKGNHDRAQALAEKLGLSDVAAAAYRKRLTTPPQVIFPQGKLRKEMLAQRQANFEAWRASDPATRPNRALMPGMPRSWAFDMDEETVEPAVNVEVRRFYLLDEAALALALVHDDSVIPRAKADLVPRHTGTLRKRLQQAGQERVLLNRRRIELVDPEIRDAYEAVLLDQKVFPSP